MKLRPRLWSLVIATIVALLGLSACTSGSGKTSGKTTKPSTASQSSSHGSTVTFALNPGSTPDYIFPMITPSTYEAVNRKTFSFLMWRPLYWFEPLMSKSISLAYPPVFSDHDSVVTIRMKPYKWSDGQPVTNQDVLFWMQLLDANKINFGPYVPGGFPDNVRSMALQGTNTIIFHLNRSYNPSWFLYNELSQITPIPKHVWDRESLNGPVGNYAATPAGAKKVYQFLNNQSMKLGTYGTNPLWKVVDGPYRISQFLTDGQATLSANYRYSGANKPKIAHIVELPFTSPAAEINALLSGRVDVGYLPVNDLPAISRIRAQGYNVKQQDLWSIALVDLNFKNPAKAPLFRQLYLRQALQSLIDQKTYIQHFLHGAGYPSYGPVPQEPKTPFLSSFEESDPTPYDPASALRLLREHGWAVHVNGADVCQRPGSGPTECGSGITRGEALKFNLIYASGDPAGTAIVEALRSSWLTAGIDVSLVASTPSGSIATTADCPTKPASSADCKWQMADYASVAPGYSWEYGDDYEPTGEEVFGAGALANSGSYNDPTTNRLINEEHYKNGLGPIHTYENYLARQMPGLWIPNMANVVVWSKKLEGMLPLSPLQLIAPEKWRFTG